MQYYSLIVEVLLETLSFLECRFCFGVKSQDSFLGKQVTGIFNLFLCVYY